jgi:hypothetical protein
MLRKALSLSCSYMIMAHVLQLFCVKCVITYVNAPHLYYLTGLLMKMKLQKYKV